MPLNRSLPMSQLALNRPQYGSPIGQNGTAGGFNPATGQFSYAGVRGQQPGQPPGATSSQQNAVAGSQSGFMSPFGGSSGMLGSSGGGMGGMMFGQRGGAPSYPALANNARSGSNAIIGQDINGVNRITGNNTQPGGNPMLGMQRPAPAGGISGAPVPGHKQFNPFSGGSAMQPNLSALGSNAAQPSQPTGGITPGSWSGFNASDPAQVQQAQQDRMNSYRPGGAMYNQANAQGAMGLNDNGQQNWQAWGWANPNSQPNLAPFQNPQYGQGAGTGPQAQSQPYLQR
jgi:hypothetical protein